MFFSPCSTIYPHAPPLYPQLTSQLALPLDVPTTLFMVPHVKFPQTLTTPTFTTHLHNTLNLHDASTQPASCHHESQHFHHASPMSLFICHYPMTQCTPNTHPTVHLHLMFAATTTHPMHLPQHHQPSSICSSPSTNMVTCFPTPPCTYMVTPSTMHQNQTKP